MAAPAPNIEPKPTLPSIRDFLSKTPMLPMGQENLGSDVPYFVVPSEQDLSDQYLYSPVREDEDEATKLRRQRRIERNRQSAMAFRSRRKEREVEDVKKESDFPSWGSRYMSESDACSPLTYQSAHESQVAAWKMVADSAAGVPQVPESPRRMSRVVDPVDVALEERRRRNREAQRPYRRRVQSLEKRVERMIATSQTLPDPSLFEEDVFNEDRYTKSSFVRLLNEGADKTEDHGFRITEDHDIGQLSIKSKIPRSFTGGLRVLREKYRYLSSHESIASLMRSSLGAGGELLSHGRGDYGLGNDDDDDDSIESMIAAADAVFFSGGLSERVRWDWSTYQQEYLQTIGYGTASIIRNYDGATDGFCSSAERVSFPNTKGIGKKLQFEKPIPWSEQDQPWARKYGQDTSHRNYLSDYHSALGEGRYSGFSWSRLRRILEGNGKLATAMIFLARLTGAVASSTESQPGSPESLLETTMLAACLGAVFTAVVYLERCKEVLTPLMIVMPFACLDLGREIAFPERQLLLVATFSASLNIAWLKSKLSDLPRTGGLTALLIATFGFLSACGAAYYLPAMGGRYADRFILAAISTLFTTMVWSVFWVVCFHNLGLAQRLEVGEYDEHIGAFTKRIFETWINQLITHVCESLISRLIGSNSLPTGLKQHAGDVESVPTGGLSRRESFWTAVDAPPTPPQSWRGDMSPSTQ